MVEDVSATGQQLFEFLFNFEALSEVVAEEPMGLFLDGDGDEVEGEEEQGEVEESVL